MRFVASGREALSLLERDALDAVVTDMRMPGMDGAHLLAAVAGASRPHVVRSCSPGR